MQTADIPRKHRVPASFHVEGSGLPSNRQPSPWKQGRIYSTSSSAMRKRSRLSVKGSVSGVASARYTPECPRFHSVRDMKETSGSRRDKASSRIRVMPYFFGMSPQIGECRPVGKIAVKGNESQNLNRCHMGIQFSCFVMVPEKAIKRAWPYATSRRGSGKPRIRAAQATL